MKECNEPRICEGVNSNKSLSLSLGVALSDSLTLRRVSICMYILFTSLFDYKDNLSCISVFNINVQGKVIYFVLPS